MSSSIYTRFRLQPHPATPCTTVESLWVGLSFSPQGELALRYELTGDLPQLRIPPAAATPTATDGLWQHTCFEAFASTDAAPAYREFNFSPAGHWAVYDFEAERVRAPRAPAPSKPAIEVDQSLHTLLLTATLPAEAVAPFAHAATRAPSLLGLTAVVESAQGQLSYWALAHPQPVPDFHARAGWTARIAPF